MSSAALYSRRYVLTFGTLARPGLAVYGNTYGGGARTPTPLRLAFDIDKTCTPVANKGHVQLTNMSEQNRANIRPGLIATLEVGYFEQMQTLFIGAVQKSQSDRQSGEITTTIELADALAAIQNVVLDKAYGPGTALAAVLSDCCAAMQVPSPAQPDGTRFGLAQGTPSFRFAKGLTIHGPVRDTLSRLCRSFGLEWSMQNGALQIVPLKGHAGLTAERLAPSTGLIGTPSFDGSICRFDALLNPRIVPGALVALDSKSVQGVYKVRKGKWAGDTHGQPWICQIEAIPMNIGQSALPSTRLPLRPSTGS